MWEKTHVISGHFRVSYLQGDGSFQTSIDFLRQTLNAEITMIDNIALSDVSAMSNKCREEFDQFLQMKSNQPSMTIISLQYPFQQEIQMILFGLKSAVRLVKTQLTILTDKYQMKTIRLDLNSSQVKFSRSFSLWKSFCFSVNF